MTTPTEPRGVSERADHAMLNENERRLIDDWHGPAFPVDFALSTGGTFRGIGMSLRDYFAGQALESIGTWMPITDRPYTRPDMAHADLKTDEALKARAEWAYRQADAMLRARSNPEAGEA